MKLLAVLFFLPLSAAADDFAAGPAYAKDLPPPFYPVLHQRPAPRRRYRLRTLSGPTALAVPPDLRDSVGPIPTEPAKPPLWRETPSSLLLFDGNGELLNDLGLGRWTEDLDKSRVRVRTMRGGVSPDGRFAWHWQGIETVRRGHVDRVLSSARMFVYLDTAGNILWRNSDADSPKNVRQSGDGETVLMLLKNADGYSAAAFDFRGNKLMEVWAAKQVERLHLTKNGRFAHLAWARTGRPLTHTFLDLSARARWDIPAADTPLGRARIDDGGTIRSGEKILHGFLESRNSWTRSLR